jgi:hypothetical protein
MDEINDINEPYNMDERYHMDKIGKMVKFHHKDEITFMDIKTIVHIYLFIF